MNQEATFGVYDVTSLSQMMAYAEKMASLLGCGDTLLLSGPLGAGKTTFASQVIQSLTIEKTLTPSPTFALVHPYDTLKGPLWHVDLYRLTPEEVPALGLEEHWQAGITLIEWPDRLTEHPPCPLTLIFTVEASTQKRHLSLKGNTIWHNRLTSLNAL